MTPRRSFLRAALLAATILSVPVALFPVAITPAYALFGLGRIVFDPSNYAENVLQAARALEQINNQIQSLQNEAQMLINQARNLASLPYSSLQRIQQSVERTQQLLGEAQRIAFDVQEIDRIFSDQYSNMDLTVSDQKLVELARERWGNTVGALKDAMRVQAGVVGNIETQRVELSNLVGESQGATGALQATQAGNQILALQAQQLTDLTALLAANGRADALSSAEQAAAAEQGREQRRRFLEPGAGYRPGNAQMFRGGN
ncbi:P-type conjugative transfer protein TrbJ [Mesorhizobium australicum]|uniref:P-type conjugative transfer protein TrbJ n=1 Tax=Mesorhizobium australicum TaxID=536018 RepID=A0A1X7NT19_9HYPH|nr:P-type conjugative transfer protein TrbJ [Mesorhizobium australicum]SMH40838.1 P-type conjugative transfer protein TrbJ [Mesorhizobium australicum]